MISDLEIARLCASIYDPSFTAWDHLWVGAGSGDIYAGIKDNTIVFRGSITIEDWLRDFCAIPQEPFDHPQLGYIHAGFYDGMDIFYKEAAQLLGANPIICGHSLGAAHAWLFAGRYIAEGGSAGRITVFGSPRPGCERLRKLLAGTPKASYKNRLDPVTNVPIWLPTFPVVDMAPFTMLDEKPVGEDFDLLADHHINLYVQGVSRNAQT